MNARSVRLLVAAGVLGLTGCAAGSPAPSATRSVPPPEAGRPVVLDGRVPGWQTSAWLADGTFCVRGARVGGDPSKDSAFCDPAPAALAEAGPPLLPAKPQPYLVPLDPQSRDILLVGTVRGDVATVSAAMFGETATAKVHPLPTTDRRRVGAYALWLPRSAGTGDGMNLDDITAVVARDAAGRTVARLG